MSREMGPLTGFIEAINRLSRGSTEDSVLLYRGHESEDYEIKPSVLRNEDWANREHDLLHELVATHPNEFDGDPTALEQLARAQHYGLPTRLLDATWNPLVALYFAAQRVSAGTPDLSPDGEVIVFRVRRDRVKFYDSHTVACIANFAHLKPGEREEIRQLLESVAPDDIETFNEKKGPVRRLLDSIKEEKPYFSPRIVPEHMSLVLCVKPKKNNPRILVQAGAFLIWGLVDGLDDVDGIDVEERIRVPESSKVGLLTKLDRLGIHDGTMFPEIDKAADYIKRDHRRRGS